MDKTVVIKMKLKPLVAILTASLALIAIAGITLAIINLVSTDFFETGDIIENVLIAIFNSALLVEAVLSLFYPRYKINDKKFACTIGLINLFSVNADKITALKFYLSGEVVIFTESEHFVLSVLSKDYDKLKKAVIKFCKNALLDLNEE